MIELKVNEQQLQVLLDDVFRVYGYDFSEYSRASLLRRVNRLMALDRFPEFTAFRRHLLLFPEYLSRFVQEITVNVTEMFRDPGFYRYLRRHVLPEIASRPFIRIWHAGCASGEEVYSMAILLKECGLLHKSLLYATDLNPEMVERTKLGIFPLLHMRNYSEQYLASGGTADFSAYYTAQYDKVIFRDELRERMICATHNLVSDRSFNEFQLILCRNVLIYFDRKLQERVFDLFDASLERLGFLALGTKETLKFSGIQNRYQQEQKEKVWKKLR